MKQDDFEAYKKAIKQHYEKEKKGNYSSFLLQPSRANLRKLCVERLKENAAYDDPNTFKIFMGFEFKPENMNKLKNETDRFRAIENFLKGSTDSNDLETINLTAILVDFSPRPFLKFVRSNNGEKNATTDIVVEKDEAKTGITSALPLGKEPRKKKKLILGLLGFTALFSIGYTAKDLVLPEKECMQWQDDHYVELACESQILGIRKFNEPIPYNEIEFNRRKLKVCDTTTFFKNGKAIIWYSKENNVVAFYNMDGIDPINGKELKRITQHMIHNHVDPCR
ncbi:hypothetical protein [Flavobacterium sp. 102]|uniref:hypothetical protein n=1 Tax=Flavobacterium sp. 102 TaxID=2135623 RepID=UPI000EAF197C|nr:hypothetical protein [Flavobacterium sp. 102]RKS00586.1 hypothetical protein C8C84_0205 [Flavobacterium sp. 102]